MPFGQIEISLLDAEGKPGLPIEVGVHTSNAGEGDWVTYDGRHYRILTPHHIEEKERTPRLRTRFYLQEGTPPPYFLHDYDGGHKSGPTPIRPGLAKLYSVPREQPQAIGDDMADQATNQDDGEKRVRAVYASPELLAKTVPRPFSRSQIQEAFSAALMAEAVRIANPPVIITGGQVMDAIPSFGSSVASAPARDPSIQTTQHFELNSRDERPTLRLVRTARTTIPEGIEAPRLVTIETAPDSGFEPAQSTNLTTPDAVPAPAIVAAQLRKRQRGAFASFAAPMAGVTILAVAVVFLIEAPYRHDASTSSAVQAVSVVPIGALDDAEADAGTPADPRPDRGKDAISCAGSSANRERAPVCDRALLGERSCGCARRRAHSAFTRSSWTQQAEERWTATRRRDP